MTRKEQNKILDDKIKAYNAQYNLDRLNAEISAYSSGNLPKYDYLTNKDLSYKPDAFEQGKFEYSPLGKVFTDGLDKFNRKEGLLKILKNIEDRSNNRLLALGDIKDEYNDEYKTIQIFKKELIDKDILIKDGEKQFYDIINKWKQIKGKELLYINNKNKVDTGNFNMYEIFKEYLNGNIEYEGIDGILNNIERAFELYQKKPKYTDKNNKIISNTNKFINGIEQIKILIDNDNFRIPEKYHAKPNNNVDLDWMNDKDGFENTAEDVGADYMK